MAPFDFSHQHGSGFASSLWLFGFRGMNLTPLSSQTEYLRGDQWNGGAFSCHLSKISTVFVMRCDSDVDLDSYIADVVSRILRYSCTNTYIS